MTDKEIISGMLKRADERQKKIQRLEAENEILRILIKSKDTDIANQDLVIRKLVVAMRRMVSLIPEDTGDGAKSGEEKADK